MGLDASSPSSIFRDGIDGMAFFSDLVRAVAQAEGMDEMTVTGIGQYVRDAGFITKGGRGRSAAKMTSRDAANLLIAVNGTSMAKDGPRAVENFRDLTTEAERIILQTSPLAEFAMGSRSFGVALERLIEWSAVDKIGGSKLSIELRERASASIKPAARKIIDRNNIAVVTPRLEIEFRRPTPSACIRMMVPWFEQDQKRTVLSAVREMYFNLAEDVEEGLASDRRDTTSITDTTLKAVASVLYN